MTLKDYIAKLQELPQDLEVFISDNEFGPTPVEQRDPAAVTNVYAYAPEGNPTTDEGPAWYELLSESDNDPDHLVKKVVML
jgi:hypothetical protein